MAVVIDVLRATSTIVTALAAGAEEIRPAASPEEVRTKLRRLEAARGSRDKLLLGGERFGLKIEGFDLGNSPLEYTPETVGGRIILFSTTNGTRTLRRAAGRRGLRDAPPPGAKTAPSPNARAVPLAGETTIAKRVLVAAFLNAQAVADRLLEAGQSVVMACAGTRGGFSLEDILLAGLLVDHLERRAKGSFVFRDLARAAAALYRSLAGEDGEDLARAVVTADHARYLTNLGFAADVAFCATRDLTGIVPEYAAGRVRAWQPRPG